MKKLFKNGSVITMRNRETTNALLIEDGRILALGEEALGAEERCAQVIDLRGGALLPGFVDPHSHITQFAMALAAVNLSSAGSIEELVELLKKRPGTGWLIGYGYDNNTLKEGRHPTREDLDCIGRPVLISHASGHMGVMNTKALELAGISETAKDPEGGVYGRKDGRLTGYMEEKAFMAAAAKAPRPTMEELRELMKEAQQIYFSYGITTAQDGLMKQREYELLQRADLKIDVVAYADMAEFSALPKPNKGYERHFKVGGYKIFLDGSPQGRTAWMTKPYEKAPGQEADYRGYPIYTNKQLKALVRRAEEEGVQLIAHCNGDAAIDQFLSAFEQPTKHRCVIIHAQTMRKDQLPIVKEKGLMPSYFVAHTWHWGDAHIKNLGMERAKNISPLASTARLGIPFTLHQDTPVLPPDMIDTLYCAANRVTAGGKQLALEEAVDVYTALAAVTANGAYQYFEEGEKGTLEPGKRADLVVLDKDPLKVEREKLREMKVLATYKGGELVYKRE